MAMSGYTKLFASIVTSTVWREPDHVRLVWITMLALADKWGIIEASIPGLADMARVTIPQCQDAIRVLSGPDTFSRTQTSEGRRVEATDGGWQLINHGKYREKMSADERRVYNATKQREHRAKSKESLTVIDSQTVIDKSALSAHTEAEAEADTKAEAETEAKTKIKRYIAPSALTPLPQTLADLWNASCGSLPHCLELKGARHQKAAARLRDRTLDEWEAIISRIASSTFCTGQNDRGWVATFDWLLQPETATKVLEGKYDNRQHVFASPPDKVQKMIDGRDRVLAGLRQLREEEDR